MSGFEPFRGIRFDEDRIGDISRVICPPYDVISPEQQRSLHDLHPRNAVRLDFPEVFPDDNERHNRYCRAQSCFRDWLGEGTLVQDPKPSYYFLEERFEDEQAGDLVRYGILGLKRLEENRAGASIRPHETTFDAPKQDRFRLMKATASNFSPIFAVYQDPGLRMEAIFKAGPRDGKYTEATGLDNVRRRLFVLSDRERVNEIEDFLGGRPLLIADGHHRYATAMNYRDWRRAEEPGSTGAKPYDYTLMYVTNIESPGLRVYPTHRILKRFPGMDPYRFLKAAEETFSVVRLGSSRDPRAIEIFLRDLKDVPPDGIKIGCKFKDPDLYCILSVTDFERLAPLFPAETPSLLRELDVSILHEIVLGRLIGLSREQQGREEFLVYTKGERAAIEVLDSGSDMCAAFLLNPAPVRKIMKIAFEGILLPQKTTYFFPKLMTGFVFRNMEMERGEATR